MSNYWYTLMLLEHDLLTLVDAYARNGRGAEAIGIYRKIPEHVRDAVSHGSVLNACSHSGMIPEARSIFNQIETKSNIIFTTMVCNKTHDTYPLYGTKTNLDRLSVPCVYVWRSSRVCLASMRNPTHLHWSCTVRQSCHWSTIHFQWPTSSTCLVALLSGARNHRQSVLSKHLYDRMRSLFPHQNSDLISASILLSNTYASVGDYQQSRDVRLHRLKHFGKKTKPGVSWTEVNGKIFVRCFCRWRWNGVYTSRRSFVLMTVSHERSDEIHDEIKRLADDLKQAGHHFDSTWVIRPLEDDETVESVLCGHSEKLALAFNLIQRPAPTFIQITKNLRICGDCRESLPVDEILSKKKVHCPLAD